MANVKVRDQLAIEANVPANRGYADNGIADYKQAVSRLCRDSSAWLSTQLPKLIIASEAKQLSPCFQRASLILATLR